MSSPVWWLGRCVEHSHGCGEERHTVAVLPALRKPQSGAEGAAQVLHSVVQGVGGVAPDGCQPGQHPPVCHLLLWVQAAAQNRASSLNQLVQSLTVPVCGAPSPTHDGIKHCWGHHSRAPKHWKAHSLEMTISSLVPMLDHQRPGDHLLLDCGPTSSSDPSRRPRRCSPPGAAPASSCSCPYTSWWCTSAPSALSSVPPCLLRWKLSSSPSAGLSALGSPRACCWRSTVHACLVRCSPRRNCGDYSVIQSVTPSMCSPCGLQRASQSVVSKQSLSCSLASSVQTLTVVFCGGSLWLLFLHFNPSHSFNNIPNILQSYFIKSIPECLPTLSHK